MVSAAELVEIVKRARSGAAKRNFKQSFEVTLTLRDIDVKKQDLNINEVVFLPNGFSKKPSICVIGSGDLALRARRAGADMVLESGDLDRYSVDKKGSKKLSRSHYFFLAETSLMPKVGRVFGPFLGPRGKMPTPVPPAAPIEGMISRFKQAVRARSRRQLAVSSRAGDEDMSDEEVAGNILAIVEAVAKKLPSGERNIKSVAVKLTMGKLEELVVKQV